MPYRPEDLAQQRLRQSEAVAERKVREGQYTPSDPLYKLKDTGGEIGAPTAMDDVRGFMYDLNDTPTEGAQISPGMAGEAALAALTSGGSVPGSVARRAPAGAAKARSLSGGVGKAGPKVRKEPRGEYARRETIHKDDIDFSVEHNDPGDYSPANDPYMMEEPSRYGSDRGNYTRKRDSQGNWEDPVYENEVDKVDAFYTARKKAGQEGEILTTDSRIPDPVSESAQRNDTFRTRAGGYSPRGKGEGASTNPQRVTYKPDSGGTKGMNPGRRRQMQLEQEGRPSGRANVSSDMERQGGTDPVQGETQRRLRQTPVGKKSSKRRDAADREARGEGPDSKKRVSASSKKRKKDKDEEINYSYGDD